MEEQEVQTEEQEVVETTETETAATETEEVVETEEQDDPDYEGAPVIQNKSQEDGFVKVPKEEYETLVALKEKAAMLDHPVVQSIINQVQSGKSVEEVVSKGLVVDWKSMPAVDVYRKSLDETPDLTSEERQELIDAFLEKAPAQQKIEVASLRKHFDELQKDNLSKMNLEAQQNQQKRKEISDKFEQDFASASKKWTEKGVFGIEVTPERVKEVENWIRNINTIFLNPDGTINADRVFRAAFQDIYGKEIQKNTIRKTIQKEREEHAAVHQNATPAKGVTSTKSNYAENQVNQAKVDDYFTRQAEKYKRK